MKKIVSFLILISLTNSIISQNWTRNYENVDFIQSVLPLSNGDILAIAGKQKARIRPLDSIILLRIDRNGNLLKSFTWRLKFHRLPLISQSNDSTILFLFDTDMGKPVNIISFSLNLDSLNTKTIFSEPNKFFDCRKMKKLSDGNILIAAQISSDTAFLIKLSSNGLVIRSQKYRIPDLSSFTGINDFVEEDNGNITFICAGYQNRAFNNLFKVDKNLQILKIIELDTEKVTDLYKSTDNGFLLLYNGIFIKLDNNGNKVSNNDLNRLIRNILPAPMIYMGNDKLIFIHYEYDSLWLPKKEYLIQVSMDKVDTLCSFKLENLYYSRPFDGSRYSFNEILLCGLIEDTLTTSYKGYVIKSNINCNSSFITETPKRYELKIYPNPFHANTTVTFEDNIFNNINKSILVYDIFGRLSFKDEFKNSEYQLDKGNLPAGLYFVSIYTGNEIIGTKKIIIE